MRFCTTCGRNFEGDLPECPHDGTPLFDMGGPTKEPLLAEASEPWAATNHSEVELESSEISEFGVDDSMESRSKEFPNPIVAAEATLADLEDDSADPGEFPVDLESALFDDEPESESSMDIASGIDDILGEDGSDEFASKAVKIEEKEEPILDDALKPIQAAKPEGGGKILPILLVLLILGAAGFYFVGGGKEMLSRSETPVKKKALQKKVKVVKPKVIKKEIPKPPIEEPKIDEKKEEALKPAEGSENTDTKNTDTKTTEKKVEKVEAVKKTGKKKTPKKAVKVEKKKVVKKIEKKTIKKKPPVKKELKKKVIEKKELKEKIDDPEELLRKELEAMEGG